ncbi:hypothetical protein ACLOAV_007232 [Pseudogymnoascus australis]
MTSISTAPLASVTPPLPPQTLSGKTAIISGSCSGIGAEIARELSSRGCDIVINYPFPSLEAQALELSNSLPSRAISVCADISTVDGPQTLVNATVKEFGNIDILVNNAAIAVNLPLEEQTMEHWDSLVNLNGRGTFLLT